MLQELSLRKWSVISSPFSWHLFSECNAVFASYKDSRSPFHT